MRPKAKKKRAERLVGLFVRMKKAHDSIFSKFSDDPEQLRSKLLGASCILAEEHARAERARMAQHEREEIQKQKLRLKVVNLLPTSTREEK